MQGRPAKAVPKDGSKEDEDDEREDKIIKKLPDKGGNVGTHGVGKPAVGIFTEAFADGEIEGIVDERRGEKGDGTAEKDKPRAAEYRIETVVIPCI